MARIPEAEIEQLKRGVSVAKLAEAHGVKLRQHGADLLGLCPFHADRTPSLVIALAKNLWHCLGACGTGGSDRLPGLSWRVPFPFGCASAVNRGGPRGRAGRRGRARRSAGRDRGAWGYGL